MNVALRTAKARICWRYLRIARDSLLTAAPEIYLVLQQTLEQGQVQLRQGRRVQRPGDRMLQLAKQHSPGVALRRKGCQELDHSHGVLQAVARLFPLQYRLHVTACCVNQTKSRRLMHKVKRAESSLL